MYHQLIFNTNIFEGLIAKDQDEKLVPGLATSWEPIDETTWVFELREDITFHDGEKFNAEVAKKNFDRILDPNLAAPRAFLFDSVKEFTVLDEYKLQITTEYPFSPILAHLSHPVSAMISPKSIDEDYAAIEDGKEAGSVINAHPIGTSYFKFENWDPWY